MKNMYINAKYDNCKIYSQDDKFLGFCDKKKYDWYIRKDLVTIIDDKSIKLNFEPKINGHNGQFEEFCKTEIKTQCVICGNKETLNKFHVVPLEFRRLFPLHMKSHASHDVVLVCEECQGDLNHLHHQYKTHLFEKFNLVPNPKLLKIKAYANQKLRLLKKEDNEFNKKKLYNCEQELKKYLGHEPTLVELNELRDICTFDDLGEYKTVAEFIVNQYKDNLEQFEKNWRDIFVENMEPKFLPGGW